jgi:4-amino-4-deoxy-L-arabinose transferase-like glycosyltransferase
VKKKLIIVIAIGFAIRLFCFHYTYIINPDGPLYIHQARSVYYSSSGAPWNSVLIYFSNYPLLIAGIYSIIGNWVIAAKVVSLIFGTMLLVPLYLLSKRFFDERIALLLTLVFALMPFLVDRSVDVVRAPVFWFFLVLGMHFFIVQVGEKRHFYLLLSSLSFVFAAWARIEGILFIGVSYIFMLIMRQERKLVKLGVFSIPIVLLVIVFFLGLGIFDLDINDLFYFSRVMPSHFDLIGAEYENIRAIIKELAHHDLGSIVSRFLLRARHLIWWVALGTLLTGVIWAFFYPFFIVFLMGFKGVCKKIKEDKRILYLLILSFSAFLFLYIVVLILWEMPTRYVGILVFPSSVFIGFGLEKVMLFLRSRFNLKESIAFLIVCMLVLVFSLPKNLKPREKDKVVFKEIGQLVAEREGNAQEILVATSQQSIRWISFYSNLDYKGAPSPEKNYDLDNILGKNYEEFVRNLRERKIQYFLWEEKHWPQQSSDYLRIGNSADFIRVGNWSHPDTGKLILFKVI